MSHFKNRLLDLSEDLCIFYKKISENNLREKFETDISLYFSPFSDDKPVNFSVNI